MSVLVGPGYIICYSETEVTCPICEQIFDAGDKISKAKYPVFSTKCPTCKGKITISVGIFGGGLKCWETDCPSSIKRLETITPDKVNGKVPIQKLYDDNSDEKESIYN